MKKFTTPILILLAVLIVSASAWGQAVVTKAAIPPGTTRADGSAHQNNDTLVWLTAYNRWVAAAGGGGSSTFITLTDAPASFSGAGLKAVRVNTAANALEFIDLSTLYLGLHGTADAATLWGAYATLAGPTQARIYTFPDSAATMLYSGGALGTPASGTLTSCTFPTLNQDSTGSAIYWKTSGTGKASITGPATGQTRTYTFPDANATLVYQNIASQLLGTASSATGSAAFYNSGNANAFTIQPGATGAALSWTLPIAAAAGNGYLVTASTAGVLTYTDPTTLGGAATATDEVSDTSCFPLFATDATGAIAFKTAASKLTFNSATGMLSSTGFTGAVTGTSSGNLPSPVQIAYTSATPWTPAPAVGTAGAEIRWYCDSVDHALAFGAPTGTPVNGQGLTITLASDGTAHALDFTNAAYVPVGVVLPTTTVISKITTLGCRWHSGRSKWLVYAVSQE